MLRALRNNLALKIIAILASMLIWYYANAERNPNQTERRVVSVGVVRTGTPRRDTIIVRLPQQSYQVEIVGPKSEIFSVGDNEIKARVDVTDAVEDTTFLRVRYDLPDDTPNVRVVGREMVKVEVLPKRRKQMRIEPFFNNEAPAGMRYSMPRLDPEWAYVVGTAEELERVARLVVFIETGGGGVQTDAPIKAVDRNNLELPGVQIEPKSTQVTLNLVVAPASRSLVVSVSVRGTPARPLQVEEVSVEPRIVTVVGKPEQLGEMSSVPTAEISIEGLTADITREVSLQLPPGVTLKSGRNTASVTIRLRDPTKPGL